MFKIEGVSDLIFFFVLTNLIPSFESVVNFLMINKLNFSITQITSFQTIG